MPASQIIGFSPVTLGDGIKAGTRRALCPANTLNAVGLSLEHYSQLPVRVAGQFDRGFAYIADNTLNGLSFLALRRNAADSPIVLPVGAGQTGGLLTLVDSVAFSASDSLSWGLDTRMASAGLTNPVTVAQRFVPDDPNLTVAWAYTGGSGGGFSANNVTRYASMSGTVAFQSDEAFAKARVHGAFVVGQLGVEIATNNRVTPIIFRTRINGVDGLQVITVPAGATGRFFATGAMTDAVAPGATFNYSATTGSGGGSFNVRWICAPLISFARQWVYAATNVNAANVWAADGPRYIPFAGNLANVHPVQALAQVPTFAQRVSKLSVYVSANNTTTPTVVRTGPAGVQTTYAPGQVGWSENLVDVHDIGEDELTGLEIIPGGGSGQIVFRAITLIGETLSGGALPQPPRLITFHKD